MTRLSIKYLAKAFLVPVSILFSIFVLLVFTYLILMARLLSSSSVLQEIGLVSIPLRGNIPGFNMVGYVLPLSATILLGVFRLSKMNSFFQKFRASFVEFKWWYLAAIIGVAISFIIPTLSASGHTDYPLSIVVATFVAANLKKYNYSDTLISSFALGYLVGFVSDLQSQVFFTGYFGGGGFLDGDFMLPIFLCIAVAISRPLVGFLESRGMKVSEC